MDIKICYIDVETSGLDPKENGITQLSGYIEINENIVEEFNYYIQPFPNDKINDESINICGFTKDMLFKEPFVQPTLVHQHFTKMLEKYVDRYNKQDKLFFCGYNCQSFDSRFVREFFEKCNDKYYGSYFWHPTIDMMLIYSRLLIKQRHLMKDFKLVTVAEALCLDVDKNNLHNSMYDVKLTRDLWLLHNKC